MPTAINAGQSDHRLEAAGQLVEPGAEPTFFFEPAEHAFDRIALAVRRLIEEPR